jgi:heme A synthase
MRGVARLGWVCLTLAFGQVVFGAIVRITGSGMGCGDHWPKCQGEWIPPLDRVDLIIEVTHRYIAATLAVAIVLLVVSAWRHRRAAGGAGRGGAMRAALLSAGLVVAAAMFGAVSVRLALTNKIVIVTHLAIAMALLAALVSLIVRARGDAARGISAATARDSALAATLCFVAVVLGALTANVPGANTACQGFPLCRGGLLTADPQQYLQLAHRLVAFALFLYLGWLGVALTRRREAAMAGNARLLLTVTFLQLVVAATMIGLGLPPLWRSLHEAVGTLLWVALFGFAYVSHRRARLTEPNEAAAVVGRVAQVRA